MPLPVTYILSNIHKALAFEWVAEELDRGRFGLSFVLLNPGDSVLETFLRGRGVDVLRVAYRGKKDLPAAIFRIVRFLRTRGTRVVHCHLFDACVAGLVAARLAGVKKRLYTRHYATFHQVYFPRAVYYDRFINAQATGIVAISGNVKGALRKEGVNPRKVHLVHHGFRLEAFGDVAAERTAGLRSKYGLAGKGPVVGVISRYFELKGIQYVVPAFRQLLARFPGAHLVLANATGDYAATIRALLSELPAGSYTEIRFEEDVAALYGLFDVFLHVPINEHLEAFGQTYVEALAAGVPSVFTLSGVAPEFIEDGRNALVVPFRDAAAIYEATSRLLEDAPLRQSIVAQGRADVQGRFSLHTMIHKLEELYQDEHD
ncbi:MAG: Glycosyltransferase [uncultured Cytophagales bacterium]|uniref:Glycosyltransferase n=1 Tax=uncultured Cytophagales bacterium TaxID=158755 RepID=A0A6J4KMT0_9SPHI|nr:MAG: Glycosyltransferase [uncultured Cytophagales bacterium]